EAAAALPGAARDGSRLAAGFGVEHVPPMTLGQARAWAELGVLLGARDKPEPEWLNPLALPAVAEAADVLGGLAEQYREKRARLGEVFTERVLDLDLETLCLRFEQVYRGPLRVLSSAYRADRR